MAMPIRNRLYATALTTASVVSFFNVVLVLDAGRASAEDDFVASLAAPAAHYRAVKESIESRDVGIRTEALQKAMKDSDPAIRGLAISGYLTRFHDLTPEVVLETGGSLNPEDVPQMGLSRIVWSDDGKSGDGAQAVRCSGYYGVHAQVSNGRLTLRYEGLCLPPGYNSKVGTTTKDASKLTPAPCTVILALTEHGGELSGPLRCLSISTMAKVTLQFGE